LDYTLSGGAVTFVTGAVPQAGDILLASYRVGGSSQPATFQVICNNDGSSTNGTALVSLGSCTIPAASLLPGDRLELRFHYSHEGAASGFTFSVRWGATTVASRSAAATDSLAIGEVNVVPAAGGAQYGAQSWGSELALAAAAGNAPDSLSAGINIDFLGQMAASTGDSVTLRNFTVIRYPAQ
jgi:hypothetical protein